MSGPDVENYHNWKYEPPDEEDDPDLPGFDQELADRTRFGGIIVQGGVTSGLLNAVVAEELPGPGSVFLHVDWSFKAPVRPGDVITAEVEVIEVRKDKPIAQLRTTITNQDQQVVLDGSALVYTDPLP